MTRQAWERKYAREPAPWRGPVHTAPLLGGLRGRVVELGAGGGKVGEALPAHAVALDWVAQALPPQRPRVLADVRALPLRDLDAIVAIHVLGHLLEADRASAAHAWARALRPGGTLVVEVFARGDAREGSGREIEPATYEREGITTHYFEADELRALFARLEGEVVAEERALRWGVRRVLRARFASP